MSSLRHSSGTAHRSDPSAVGGPARPARPAWVGEGAGPRHSGRAVRLVTEVPGPRSRALMVRRERAVPRGPYHVAPIFIAGGDGARVKDVDGNTFLDFAGALGCLNTGHGAAAVKDRVRAQTERFLSSCFHVMPHEPYVALAERLCTLAPIEGPTKTILLNSGAEAVENAVKIARAYTGRSAVIAFEDAFHGRTNLTLTLTSKVTPYKLGFGPFAPEVYRVPYAYCYRCSYNLKPETCQVACADAIETVFKRYVDPKTVACIIAEPILGEGGFVVPPVIFFAKLREIADRHGIVLVCDEVQAGMGRAGAYFACGRLGFQPDLITAAKSLASGLPLAAVIGKSPIMDAAGVGGLGTTFGGNPLACEAAQGVLDMLADGLLVRADAVGRQIVDRMQRLARRLPLIGDVRGLGAMIGIELVKDRATRAPAKEEAAAAARHAWEHGLITIGAGTYGNIIRTLVPLVISDDELAEGLDILEDALLHAWASSPASRGSCNGVSGKGGGCA